MSKKTQKVDPEKLKEMFEQWKVSPEAKLWDEILEIVNICNDVQRMEDDFTENFRPFFLKLHAFCEAAKVPKRLKKAYDQEIIRTCYFQNKTQEHVCNGKKEEFDEREISQDSYNTQKTFKELIDIIKRKPAILAEEYQKTRKELIGKIAQMNSEYTKYAKSLSCKTIIELVNRELQPLENVIRSSYGLDHFTAKKAKGEEVPAFREEAALELFIKSLDEVCKILFFCQKIPKPLDTTILLARFKIPKWNEIRPLEYYLTQLKQKYDAFREVLKDMYKKGRNRWFYELANNVEFLQALVALIEMDTKCELIIGNPLKQDQLKFLYGSMRCIYDSPLQSKLILKNEEESEMLFARNQILDN